MQAEGRMLEFAGTEWPLNIVFRPGSSENNAVAWRGWRGNPCASLADGGKIVTCDFFRLSRPKLPAENVRGRCHMYSLGPFNVPYPDTANSNLLVTTRTDGPRPC
jgi:hypothetical protein